MPNALPADPRFRLLLVLALAGAGAGCPKDADTPPREPLPAPPLQAGSGDASDCDTPLLFDDALQPGRSVDGIALHRLSRDRGPEPKASTLSSGTLCADGDQACDKAIDALYQTAPLRRDCGQMGCTDHHLVWTDGDEHGVVNNGDALVAFLGPIDTAAEARLVAWAHRFDVGCATPASDGGYQVAATHYVSDCPIQVDTVELFVAADGTLTEVKRTVGPSTGACVGRLAPGLCERPPHAETVAAWLANAAHMEAVSVHAFDTLVRELIAHGAPEALVDAARSAMADEARHARLLGALAHRYGAVIPEVVVQPLPVRSLAEIALDNAAEGLGREAWGALLALWQARAATDPELRVAMVFIALDEVRHAEFSRALHAWLLPQISDAQRTQVDAATVAAWHDLEADADEHLSDEARRVLGMPSDPRALAASARAVGLAA